MQKQTKYKVEIKRHKPTSWMDSRYSWEVDVSIPAEPRTSVFGGTIDHEEPYSLRGYGWTFTAKKAKKKAIKHILKIEKDINSGIKFGIVFSFDFADAETAIKELSK